MPVHVDARHDGDIPTDLEARTARAMHLDEASDLLGRLLADPLLVAWETLPSWLAAELRRWQEADEARAAPEVATVIGERPETAHLGLMRPDVPTPGVSGADDAAGGGLEERRACWTCKCAFDDMGGCVVMELDGEQYDAVSDWTISNCGGDGTPFPTARNCPGYVRGAR